MLRYSHIVEQQQVMTLGITIYRNVGRKDKTKKKLEE